MVENSQFVIHVILEQGLLKYELFRRFKLKKYMKKQKITSKEKFKLLEQDDEALDKYRINFVKSQLRRASVWKWPAANIAVDRNKVEGFIKCDSCNGLFDIKQINRDHIIPVEDIKNGFTTLDNYVRRLFVKSKEIQILCLACHSSKTLVENEMRKKNGLKPLRQKKALTKKKKHAMIKKKVKR